MGGGRFDLHNRFADVETLPTPVLPFCGRSKNVQPTLSSQRTGHDTRTKQPGPRKLPSIADPTTMHAISPPFTLADLLAQLGGIALDRNRFRPAPGTATTKDGSKSRSGKRSLREGERCARGEGPGFAKVPLHICKHIVFVGCAKINRASNCARGFSSFPLLRICQRNHRLPTASA